MIDKIDLTHYHFHPVIALPSNYQVLDLSRPNAAKTMSNTGYSIGRYNERRESLYTQELFKSQRNIHVGIDIGAPVQTEICAFFAGEVLHLADNSAPGDYGPTLITQHQIGPVTIYALWGHLSRQSLASLTPGQKFMAGECLAKVGSSTENGGWPPHLHFQLSLERPTRADLPGVVSSDDLIEALRKYPDPRLVLGPLY